MAFVRMLTALVKDRDRQNVRAYLPDESRTFGMEGLFRHSASILSLASSTEPETRSADVLQGGQHVQNPQEGINEGGRALLVDGGVPPVREQQHADDPFLHFYSCSGCTRGRSPSGRRGDLRAARLPARRNRGLHHVTAKASARDGHSHIISSVVPNCVSYFPTFAYVVAVIVQDGLRRMVDTMEDVFYTSP